MERDAPLIGYGAERMRDAGCSVEWWSLFVSNGLFLFHVNAPGNGVLLCGCVWIYYAES
jgi:hypothetical protein